MSQPPGYPVQPEDPYAQQGQPPAQPWPAQPYPQPEQYPQTQPEQYQLGQPPQGAPVSGAPYPPGQPVSGGPFPPPPVSGAPYPPGQPVSGGPFAPPYQPPTTGMPGDPMFGQPQYVPGDPMFGQPQQPRRGRGLMITLIAIAVVVVLGGAGIAAFVVFGGSEGKGADTPAAAVDKFLTAVYRDKNADAATKLVCSSAKDTGAVRKRVDQLREYELKYKSPTYTWPTPTVESQKAETATVTVPVKLTTSDDRVSEQKLKIVTVKGDGWLVCEINTV